MLFYMREGPQLGVDACGVRGCIRSYRQVNLPLRPSFAHFCEGIFAFWSPFASFFIMNRYLAL